MLRLGLCLVLLLSGSDFRVEAASKNDANEKKVRDVLWKVPGKIASKDLFFGPGGKEHQPQGPFVFLKEDPTELRECGPGQVTQHRAGRHHGGKE